MNSLDSIMQGCIEIAQTSALEKKHGELSPYHLLNGLLRNPSSYFSTEFGEHKNEIKKALKELPTLDKPLAVAELKPSSKLSEWFTFASSYAVQRGALEMSERDFLRYLAQIVPEINWDLEKLGREQTLGKEIPEFLINLNQMASEGKLDPVIGRSKEIRSVIEILGRRGKNNPVLVGPAGVGKTAIVEGLADSIQKGDVPEVLKGKTVYSMEMGSLMAGTKFRGEFEERLQNLIKFVKDSNGEIILFIDEIHQLVGAGKTDGAMDAANLLKPALARGELNCIGATTEDEYQKYILGDSALDRRFRSVPVNEPSVGDSIEILMGIREKMEMHHGIKISDEAIYKSVLLSDQYITNKNLPDKAIDLIDEASSALKLSAEAMPASLGDIEAKIRSKKIFAEVAGKKDKKLEEEILSLEREFSREKEIWDKNVLSLKKTQELKNKRDKLKFDLDQAERAQEYEKASQIKYSLLPEIEHEIESVGADWTLSVINIADVISRQTGIPSAKILRSKQDHILKLAPYLNGRVFGQEEALNEMSEILLTSHVGLSDSSRPMGSFLLWGPSGVGKTESAKALSQFLFDTEKNLIRMDMSEFSEKHSVAKLTGAPAGYVGYEEGGILTEAVRRNPYSIILLDELEKAHRDFSDILLQVLDDGRLTDSKGRTIDFKNCILMATTNSTDLELDFKPEVLGRFDSILKFSALDSSIMEKLVMAEVNKLNRKLEEKKISIEINDDLANRLSEVGYDERYGARPLHQAFARLVTRPLGKKILQGVLKEGHYSLEFAENEVHFTELSEK